MRRIKIGAILLSVILGLQAAHPGRAEALQQVSDARVSYTFGETITFTARVQPSQGVQDAWIFIKIKGQSNTIKEKAALVGDTLTYTHSVIRQSLTPFSEINYWYHVTWENGQEYTMETSLSFFYADNRFTWRELESDHFIAHWYEGDILFAQDILDTAETGLARIEKMLDSSNAGTVTGDSQAEKIDIYIYARASELQMALRQGGPTWVAGHANPELNLVLVSLNPGNPGVRPETERQIPHEVAHILLYRFADGGYRDLPTWLNEGFASISELYPNPDYPLLLQDAYEKQKIISLETLCHGFPTDTSSVLLAYAQSASFVDYMIEQYGNSGLQILVREYADGKGCEVGTQAAFEAPLAILERNWRQSVFAENRWLTALTRMLPWLALLGVITGPLILTGAIGGRSKSKPSRPDEKPQPTRTGQST